MIDVNILECELILKHSFLDSIEPYFFFLFFFFFSFLLLFQSLQRLFLNGFGVCQLGFNLLERPLYPFFNRKISLFFFQNITQTLHRSISSLFSIRSIQLTLHLFTLLSGLLEAESKFILSLFLFHSSRKS